MADDSPVVARIKALGKGIVESEQNANNLVDLMEFLEVSWRFKVDRGACTCFTLGLLSVDRLSLVQ